VLDGANPIQELGQLVGVLRRDGEFVLRVVDQLDQRVAVDLGLGHADVGIRCGGLVVLGEVRRLGQCVDKGLVGLGVVVAEFLGGEQQGRRVGAEQVIAVEHHMHVLVGQRLVLERRVGEVPVQFGTAGQQRGGCIRVRHGQGVLVEAVVFLVAPLLGGGVLQEARLHRNTYRRHRNAVLVRKVGDGLHVRVAADQVVREVAQ